MAAKSLCSKALQGLGLEGIDCVETCAIAEVWNKLALELNSKTETTRAMIKKRRMIEPLWNNDCGLRDLTTNLL
jgi:hypothetical protein